MEAQRLFELCNRLGNVALAHENLSKIIVRLSQFRVKFRRLLKMLSSFRQLAFFQKQSTQIDVSVDVSRIQLQSLPIFCDCLVWLSVFFQECAIAIVRLRRLWRQTNGRFTIQKPPGPCGRVDPKDRRSRNDIRRSSVRSVMLAQNGFLPRRALPSPSTVIQG